MTTEPKFDAYEQSFIAAYYRDMVDAEGTEWRAKKAKNTGASKRGRGRGKGRGRATGTGVGSGGGGGGGAMNGGGDPLDGPGVESNVIDEDEAYRNLPAFVMQLNEKSEAADAGNLCRSDDSSKTVYDVRGKDFVAWSKTIEQSDDDEIPADEVDPRNAEALSTICISNLVVVTVTETPLNCSQIASQSTIHGFHYNPKKFAALVASFLNPTATAMVFPTGIITVLGINEFAGAMRTTRHVMDVVSQIKDSYGQPIYRDLSAKTVAMTNIVASLALFFRIDLNKMIELPFVGYEDEEFIGGIVDVGMIAPQFSGRRVKLLAFSTGSIVITGTKNRGEVFQVYKVVFPYLVQCAAKDTFGRVVQVSREQRLSIRPEIRRAATLPPDSREIIRINARKQMEVFESIHGKLDEENFKRAEQSRKDEIALRPSQALAPPKKTVRKRGNVELASELAVGRNVIALSTINDKATKQLELEEQRVKLRKALREGLVRKTGHEPSKSELDQALKRQTAPKHTAILEPQEAYVLADEILDEPQN